MNRKIVTKKIKGGTMESHYARTNNGIKLHREDGPALIMYNESGHVTNEYWFIDGERLTLTEIKKRKKSLGILN